MKTFTQFIIEASQDDPDKEGLGHGTGTTHRGGEKIGRERKKSAPEKKRTKAIGGGKTAPAKEYKQRKDAGKQRPKGRASERLQQPTQKKGVKLSAREQQRKAAQERRAAKSGGKSKKDLEKAATKLLTKKTTKAVSPNYKPKKASGYTANERRKLQRAGDRLLRDIKQKKDKPAAHYDPEVRKSK